MMHADNLVVFLGGDANTDDSTEPWEAGSGRLPNDDDLAHYIAKRAHLEDAPAELAAVAQRARATHGASALYDWLVEGLTEGIDTSPSEVLQRLAELPSLFRKHEKEPRYQIIVTTAFDGALETAFREAQEPFDLAIYTASRSNKTGYFIHSPWQGVPRKIEQANEYPPTGQAELGFPIVAVTRRLRRTVIVRLSRAVDDVHASESGDDCLIAEDDYIDFLSGRPITEVVPGQILREAQEGPLLVPRIHDDSLASPGIPAQDLERPEAGRRRELLGDRK